MKQLIRILFLCLAIVFSFGFTVSTSTCQSQGKEAHSCCKKAKKQTPPKKCKGDCCFQTTSVSKLEELEITNSSEQFLKRNSSKYLIPHFSKYTAKSAIDKTQIGFQFHKTPFLLRPKSLAIVSQSWLI